VAVPINWKTLLFVVLVSYGAWHHWETRPVAVPHGAGELAPAEPVQGGVAGNPNLQRPGYHLTPLASYDVTARVLSVEPYYFDRQADLSPVDFALGWGPMSDDEVLESIAISQRGRFYYWNVQQFPIPRGQIEPHSANTHLIPANAAVKDRIESIRPGQVVHLRGYLVEVKADDGWRWKSSLTRSDTGGGACELMWVEQAESL
jgi:hypothetical protein